MYCGYELVRLAGTGVRVGTGWMPPPPDLRDYTTEHPDVAPFEKMLGLARSARALRAAIPPRIDLREWCSPIEDQGSLGSCTANAAVGVVEYFERRAFGRHIDGSRRFVYKVTRNLMGVSGDSGAWLRCAMGALRLCGVPPARYWPYTDAAPQFDEEPPAFVYALAEDFKALRYFAHDPVGANRPRDRVLQSVKQHLAAGVPAMFGFWGFDSSEQGDEPGMIPFPCPGEPARWGHAVAAVGYDDAKKIENTACKRTATGALLIRNSWGASWGERGYGWLPYDYVLHELALDFWSLLSMDWVDTNEFGLE